MPYKIKDSFDPSSSQLTFRFSLTMNHKKYEGKTLSIYSSPYLRLFSDEITC